VVAAGGTAGRSQTRRAGHLEDGELSADTIQNERFGERRAKARQCRSVDDV